MKLIVLVSGLFLNTQPTKKTETTGPIILILICGILATAIIVIIIVIAIVVYKRYV